MIPIATIRSTRYYENFNQPNNRESIENVPKINPQETLQSNQQEMSQQVPPTAQQTTETQNPQSVPAEPANPGGPLIFDVSGDTFATDDNSGQIVVQVRTASGTQPVKDAAVIVYKNRDGKNQAVSFSLTNEDGTTPVLSLPAPKKADAQTPSDTLPFADYNITVRHPMFYTALLNNVQVFGDELTIQAVELIPLPELVNERDITKTVNIPKQNL